MSFLVGVKIKYWMVGIWCGWYSNCFNIGKVKVLVWKMVIRVMWIILKLFVFKEL